MRIAVIDDDKELHISIGQLFLQYQIANDCDFSLDYFFSCEDAYERLLSNANYDLIFLDIEFPQMCGIDFGMLLRRRMRDYDTQIVFISSTQDYAMDLFPLRPSGFLIKPISYEQFSDCLTGLMEEYARSNEFLDYTLENTRHRIRISEILYLKAQGKKVAFFTRNGSFSVYGKIPELIAGCPDHFLCTSRGEYVNLQHILQAEPRSVRLTDDHVLHISRGRINAVRERLSGL